MWKIPSGECKLYTGSTSKCETGVLLPDGKHKNSCSLYVMNFFNM